MAKSKNDKGETPTPPEANKAEVRTFSSWAEILKCVDSASGAIIRLEIDPAKELTEKAFNKLINEYKSK